MQHRPSAALFEALGQSAAQRIHEFNPQDLATTSWAFAASQNYVPRLFESISKATMPRLEEFDAQKLVWTCWAFGSLAHEDIGLMTALRGEAAKRVEEFNGQQLAMMAWGLAVFDLLDQSTLRSFSEALRASGKELQPEGLQCLFQAALAAAQHGGEEAAVERFALLLPHGLQDTARQCWLASVADTSESRTQQSVQGALHRMGLSSAAEWTTPDGLFAVDMLVQLPKGGSTVAVEVDGPTHFTRNRPYRELGATILRRRLLEARLSGPLVSVPFFEWDRVKGDHSAEEAYLVGKLRAAIGGPILGDRRRDPDAAGAATSSNQEAQRLQQHRGRRRRRSAETST